MLTKYHLSFLVGFLFFLFWGGDYNYCHVRIDFFIQILIIHNNFSSQVVGKEGRIMALDDLIHHPLQYLFTYS